MISSFFVIFLGIVAPALSLLFLNKNKNLFSNKYLFLSYIFFLIGFFSFIKVFNIELYFNNNVFNKFIAFGNSFTTGYIGGILALFLYSKVINVRISDLLALYLPSLIIMYAILKIGCFIMGCCGSYYDVPIQLLESFANIFIYVWIISRYKRLSNIKIISFSLIAFGFIRFFLEFFRDYIFSFSFWIIELFCLCIIFIGIGLNFYKEKK